MRATSSFASSGISRGHGYGLFAVFVAGLMIRRAAHGHEFNKRLHDFADESERLLMMLLLVLFGGLMAAGLLKGIGRQEATFAASMLLVIRPIPGSISLIGVERPKLELAMIILQDPRRGVRLSSELRLQSRDVPMRV
jgi:NhaP-type Na+/H+ or K+/H+ antiporter